MRILLTKASILTLTIGLAACGGGAKPQPKEPAPEPAPAPAPAPEITEPVAAPVPKAPAEAPKEEPRKRKPAKDIVLGQGWDFVLSFNDSDIKGKTEEDCKKKAKDDEVKTKECMTKASAEF